MVVYGGDEVSAVVLDVGTQTTRAGYAGEDSPRAVVPTSYGYVEGEGGVPGQYYIGDGAGPSVYRPGQTVHNPVQDGVIEDWSAMERVLEHTIRNQLRLSSLEEHPVLISESTWQSKENRERLLELAFEGWGAPAYYTVDKNVLTAFSVGKGTAMVLDVGEDVSSCMPIYDGFVIRKAIHKSPIGGSLMTNYLASLLKSGTPPIDIHPHYLVKDRIAVPPNTPPRSVLREDRLTGATESYARYMQSQVLHNFKESILQTMETPYDEQQASLRPQRAFEFPDGYNTTFGTVRYRVPEVMFNPTGILAPEFLNMPAPTTQNSVIPTPSLREAKSVQQLISSSLQLQDPDLHPTLLSNIVVVGGPTLTPGFLDRLQGELMRMPLGNAKPKIEAPGSLVGRKYSSWLGGSILASLGTFHQLWVGREEYMESGKSVINRKTR